MSTSPEAFHVLRCKCASTHALVSTCQYILGIGDRHLSNFMVNLLNGEMVGIDFGHAFGSATQVSLPTPNRFSEKYMFIYNQVLNLYCKCIMVYLAYIYYIIDTIK